MTRRPRRSVTGPRSRLRMTRRGRSTSTRWWRPAIRTRRAGGHRRSLCELRELSAPGRSGRPTAARSTFQGMRAKKGANGGPARPDRAPTGRRSVCTRGSRCRWPTWWPPFGTSWSSRSAARRCGPAGHPRADPLADAVLARRPSTPRPWRSPRPLRGAITAIPAYIWDLGNGPAQQPAPGTPTPTAMDPQIDRHRRLLRQGHLRPPGRHEVTVTLTWTATIHLGAGAGRLDVDLDPIVFTDRRHRHRRLGHQPPLQPDPD